MLALSMALNSPHQVLEERLINSTPLIVNNQLIHQQIGTYNLHKITSNPGPLLPKLVLWFKLSWGELIIMPLIMLMLRFSLQIFYLNLTLNLFQTHKPHRSNKLMMMKWNISWSSSTQNIMMIFWRLTPRYFRLGWWSPLIQNFIQSLLCCFVNMEEQILQ